MILIFIRTSCRQKWRAPHFAGCPMTTKRIRSCQAGGVQQSRPRIAASERRGTAQNSADDQSLSRLACREARQHLRLGDRAALAATNSCANSSAPSPRTAARALSFCHRCLAIIRMTMTRCPSLSLSHPSIFQYSCIHPRSGLARNGSTSIVLHQVSAVPWMAHSRSHD